MLLLDSARSRGRGRAESSPGGRRRSAIATASSGAGGLLGGEAVAEAPGVGAGVDDVCAVGEAVDDGLGQPRVGEDLGPLAERQVRRDDQRAAFVTLGEDLE